MTDVSLGDSQGLLGLAGTLILGGLSWWNLRKGQRDTHELDADKQELDRERFDHDRQKAISGEQQQVIDTLRAEIARLTDARTSDLDRADRDLERLRTRHAAERATCVQTMRQLHDDLLASAGALRSEVDATAARDAAQRGDIHLRLEHDDTSTEGNT